MLLYTSDFLSATYLLSMEERGQFITLICLQQQHGHLELEAMETAVGYLSNNLMRLLSVDEDGRYYNERADFEIQRRKKYSQRQAEISRKRWAGNATALPIETETEIEKEIEIETEKETEKENQEKKKSTPAPAGTACGKTCGKPGGESVESVWKASTGKTEAVKQVEFDYEAEMRRLREEISAALPASSPKQVSRMATQRFLQLHPGYFAGTLSPPSRPSDLGRCAGNSWDRPDGDPPGIRQNSSSNRA